MILNFLFFLLFQKNGSVGRWETKHFMGMALLRGDPETNVKSAQYAVSHLVQDNKQDRMKGLGSINRFHLNGHTLVFYLKRLWSKNYPGVRNKQWNSDYSISFHSTHEAFINSGKRKYFLVTLMDWVKFIAMTSLHVYVAFRRFSAGSFWAERRLGFLKV